MTERVPSGRNRHFTKTVWQKKIGVVRENDMTFQTIRTLGLLSLLLGLGLGSTASGAELGPLPASGNAHLEAPKAIPFDIPSLKKHWRERIEAIKAKGMLPVIDAESSFNSNKLNLRRFAQEMDEVGVALVAYSHDSNRPGWSDMAARVVGIDPWRFIPTTNGGVHPAWTENPRDFMAETMKHATADGYPLLGEFEFRHYPSPRQLKRGELFRDVDIPINGPSGQELFAFSERTGLPFEIHYEIEDALLPPLEEMLRRYPRAKVVWCHLAQIRYSGRSSIYGPDYLRGLLERYPSLYIDVAFGDSFSRYPGSGEYHARVWSGGSVKKEWVDLIVQHPWRFLAAFDLGGDRQDQLGEYNRKLRNFLNQIPDPAREIVAYKAAWRLLFGEELP